MNCHLPYWSYLDDTVPTRASNNEDDKNILISSPLQLLSSSIILFYLFRFANYFFLYCLTIGGGGVHLAYGRRWLGRAFFFFVLDFATVSGVTINLGVVDNEKKNKNYRGV
jgi:hypothetical protein